jgi:hypothetical protein
VCLKQGNKNKNRAGQGEQTSQNPKDVSSAHRGPPRIIGLKQPA